MAKLRQSSINNLILASLSADDFSLLGPYLESVSLVLRQEIFRAGEPINHVVFPDSGILSIVAEIEEGRFEVGMAGREGIVGLPLLLNVDRTPHTALVQGVGQGWQIGAQHIRAAMEASSSLRSLLMRYVHTYIVQITQTAYANAGYEVAPRLGRWILMTHDRTEGDELVLTHEFMATMLGSRRSGVTFAVQSLEGKGLIKATRGRISVRNRTGLEELAGNAYGFAEREYSKVLQFPIKK